MGEKWVIVLLIVSILLVAGADPAMAQIQAFPNTLDTQTTTHSLRQKAPPDECWAYLASPPPLPMWTNPADCGNYATNPPAKPKVNQAYIWGAAETSDSIWFGTAANANCVTSLAVDPVTDNPNGAPAAHVTDSWVCEFYNSPYYPALYPDARIGDARTPRAYQYNKITRSIVDKTPKYPNFIDPVKNPEGIFPPMIVLRGVRGAAVYNNVVLLAGPHLSPSGGILFLGWDATTGAFLGARQVTGYNNIRQFLNLNGALYTGVGTNDSIGKITGGAVLRLSPSMIPNCTFNPASPSACFILNGTPQAPSNPSIVGTMTSVAASLTLHNGRIFTVTWSTTDLPGSTATLYMSPVVPEGGLTANPAQWTALWKAGDYEPDPAMAQTYAGGGIASFDGYLWWGTLHIPMLPLLHLVHTYPPTTQEELLQDLAGTFRSTALFRGKDLDTNPQYDIVYGNYQLPVFTPPGSPGQPGTWTLKVNNMNKTALWGPSGYGNVWNTYTWSATVWKNRLWLGTLDYAFSAEQSGRLAGGTGGGTPPPNMFAKTTFGADLLYLTSASRPAFPESTNGIGNPTTYGIRNQLSSINGNLFVGMANPMNLLTDPADPKGFGGLGGWELIELSARTDLNTPTGANISVNLSGGASITYCSVNTAGRTFASTVSNSFQASDKYHPLLSPYQLNGPGLLSGMGDQPPQVTLLWTTAVWGQGCGSSGSANVTIPYAAGIAEPRLLQLQWNGTEYVWVNITSSFDANALKVSGTISGDYLGVLAVAGSLPDMQKNATLNPDSGRLGQTLFVSVTGQFTNFAPGTTTANFGTGITVNSVTVASATSAIANITIATGTTLGTRSVTVTTGTEIVTAINAFTVTAAESPLPPEPPTPPPPAAPTVFLTAPVNGATVSGTAVTVSASAPNDFAGVQFKLDGANLGAEDTAAPYALSWNSTMTTNGSHTLAVLARNAAGVQIISPTITITVNNPTPTTTYLLPAGGGVPFSMTNAGSSSVIVSHARIEQSPNTLAAVPQNAAGSMPSAGSMGVDGLALIGLRTKDGIVAEAGVSAAPEVRSGRVYVEAGGPVHTGIALSNTSIQEAQISFYFTDQHGVSTTPGSLTLPAKRQVVAFLNEPPFHGPMNLHGTFTFYSSGPIGAIALRGRNNERGEFLITTLPVAPLGGGEKGTVLAHFSDGGGWTTQVVLVNTSENPQSGTIRFFGQGSNSQSAQALQMTVNGVTDSTFNYSLAPRTSVHLRTAGSSPDIQVGSVRIAPAPGFPGEDNIPAAFAIFSFRHNGITVTETSVLAQPASSAFRLFLETAGIPGQAGAIQSGIAVANPSTAPVTLLLELTKLDGTSLGLPAATITVPSGGQVSKFLNELYSELPEQFRGIGKLTATSNVIVTGLRGRYNERQDFLISTTPPLNNATAGNSAIVFPHIANGQGYSTQLLLFGQSGSGRIFLFSQDGTLQPSSSLD